MNITRRSLGKLIVGGLVVALLPFKKMKVAPVSGAARIVDLDGGDMGRAGSAIPANERAVRAAVKHGIAEIRRLGQPDKDCCFAIEVNRLDGRGKFSHDVDVWVERATDLLPNGFEFYSSPGIPEQKVFGVYGSSGGMAATSIFYIFRMAA